MREWRTCFQQALLCLYQFNNLRDVHLDGPPGQGTMGRSALADWDGHYYQAFGVPDVPRLLLLCVAPDIQLLQLSPASMVSCVSRLRASISEIDLFPMMDIIVREVTSVIYKTGQGSNGLTPLNVPGPVVQDGGYGTWLGQGEHMSSPE